MKEYLPIGSVVLLNNTKKKIVIMGIMQIPDNDKEHVYDYIGVPYPEGYFGKGNIVFNNEDISDVIFRGYENKEREAFLKIIEGLDEIKEKNGKSDEKGA